MQADDKPIAGPRIGFELVLFLCNILWFQKLTERLSSTFYLNIIKQMCWRCKQFVGCLELVWQNKWERAIGERSKLFG